MIDELESALKRQFMIHIRPRPGFPPKGERVMMIKAYSTKQAKEDAIRKAATKEFKNRKTRDWVFVSIEELDTYVEPADQSNG